jgi:ligand-binding sensor domain-containing protein
VRPPHDVEALVLQGGTLWAGGKDGVFAIDLETFAVTPLVADVSLAYVSALLVDEEGALWIGHHAGLTRCHDGSCHTYTEEDGLPDRRVNALLLDSSGALWIGTWGGAAVRTASGWGCLRAGDGLADDMVNVLLEDREDGMWFGSYVAPRGGLSRLQGGRSQRWTVADGLPHSNITSLLQTEEGDIWAGTGLLDRGGAARLSRRGETWTITQVLTRRDGLAGAKVRSIYQDRRGVLWFGSEYDGVVRWDGSSWRIFTEEDGLAHNEVKAMLEDETGALWLATRDGLTRITREALGTLGAGAGDASSS